MKRNKVCMALLLFFVSLTAESSYAALNNAIPPFLVSPFTETTYKKIHDVTMQVLADLEDLTKENMIIPNRMLVEDLINGRILRLMMYVEQFNDEFNKGSCMMLKDIEYLANLLTYANKLYAQTVASASTMSAQMLSTISQTFNKLLDQ